MIRIKLLSVNYPYIIMNSDRVGITSSRNPYILSKLMISYQNDFKYNVHMIDQYPSIQFQINRMQTYPRQQFLWWYVFTSSSNFKNLLTKYDMNMHDTNRSISSNTPSSSSKMHVRLRSHHSNWFGQIEWTSRRVYVSACRVKYYSGITHQRVCQIIQTWMPL